MRILPKYATTSKRHKLA